eukprot:jgi/Tetstr1/433540/TSEL_022808.t1
MEVLVVDEDPVQHIEITALVDHRAAVRGFYSAGDALRYLGAAGVRTRRVAFINTNLPDKWGVALQRELAARWPDLKVQMMSGDWHPSGSGVLVKPIKPADVDRALAA